MIQVKCFSVKQIRDVSNFHLFAAWIKRRNLNDKCGSSHILSVTFTQTVSDWNFQETINTCVNLKEMNLTNQNDLDSNCLDKCNKLVNLRTLRIINCPKLFCVPFSLFVQFGQQLLILSLGWKNKLFSYDGYQISRFYDNLTSRCTQLRHLTLNNFRTGELIYDDYTFMKILHNCRGLTHLNVAGCSFEQSFGFPQFVTRRIKAKIQEINITNCVGISENTLNSLRSVEGLTLIE
jgi:hypothetical protein